VHEHALGRERETKSFLWPAVLVAYTYVAAYAAAFAVYQVGASRVS